jgi:hypothetical protein
LMVGGAPRRPPAGAGGWGAPGGGPPPRDGLGGDLFDVTTRSQRPAWELLDRLVARIRPTLDRHGELGFVESGLSRLRVAGTGAARQRRVFAACRKLSDVAAYPAEETMRPVDSWCRTDPPRQNAHRRTDAVTAATMAVPAQPGARTESSFAHMRSRTDNRRLPRTR